MGGSIEILNLLLPCFLLPWGWVYVIKDDFEGSGRSVLLEGQSPHFSTLLPPTHLAIRSTLGGPDTQFLILVEKKTPAAAATGRTKLGFPQRYIFVEGKKRLRQL